MNRLSLDRGAVARPPETQLPSRSTGLARIESLRVQNYRALRSIELKDITPLTVLLGPNGSGKSTVFDVFNFLCDQRCGAR